MNCTGKSMYLAGMIFDKCIKNSKKSEVDRKQRACFYFGLHEQQNSYQPHCRAVITVAL